MLKWKDLLGSKHSATWDYFHVDGRVAFKVLRFDYADGLKEIRPLRPEGVPDLSQTGHESTRSYPV